MISNEVQMLINRMRSNPEEFTVEAEFGDSRTRETRNWTLLMSNIVNNKPSLEILFTPEEIKALRETASEILRPNALATIVKTIVGGGEEETNLQKLLNAKQQMEMEYTPR